MQCRLPERGVNTGPVLPERKESGCEWKTQVDGQECAGEKASPVGCHSFLMEIEFETAVKASEKGKKGTNPPRPLLALVCRGPCIAFVASSAAIKGPSRRWTSKCRAGLFPFY